MTHDGKITTTDSTCSTDAAPRTLVVGIGNDNRGDDAIGLAIARAVRELHPNGVDVEELGGDALALLECWNRADTVILIDAVSSGLEAGTVMRFDALADDLSDTFGSQLSSHGIGVAEVVALAKALDWLPATLIVYGIEGSAFDVGGSLTPTVASVIETTARAIAQEASRKG